MLLMGSPPSVGEAGGVLVAAGEPERVAGGGVAAAGGELAVGVVVVAGLPVAGCVGEPGDGADGVAQVVILHRLVGLFSVRWANRVAGGVAGVAGQPRVAGSPYTTAMARPADEPPDGNFPYGRVTRIMHAVWITSTTAMIVTITPPPTTTSAQGVKMSRTRPTTRKPMPTASGILHLRLRSRLDAQSLAVALVMASNGPRPQRARRRMPRRAAGGKSSQRRIKRGMRRQQAEKAE